MKTLFQTQNQCTYCHADFTLKSDLIEHIQINHTFDGSNICTVQGSTVSVKLERYQEDIFIINEYFENS